MAWSADRVLSRWRLDTRHPRTWVVALCCALPFIVFLGPSLEAIGSSFAPANALYKDFKQEYLLGRAIADGIDPYIPLRELTRIYFHIDDPLNAAYPTPHPPTVGVVLLPLSWLDYLTATKVWFAVELLALLAAIGLTFRVPRKWLALVGLLLIGWPPVQAELVLGQVTLPMLALLAGSQIAVSTGRGRLGGALLGLALLLKPFAWPWLLVLAWRRNWAALTTCLALITLGTLVAVARIGLGPVVTYVTYVLPTVSNATAGAPSNVSLWAIGQRLWPGEALLLPIAALLLTVLWLRDKHSLQRELAVATCLAILINPISWEYSLILTLIPLALLMDAPTAVLPIVGLGLFLPETLWELTIGPNLAALPPALTVGALGVAVSKLPSSRTHH